MYMYCGLWKSKVMIKATLYYELYFVNSVNENFKKELKGIFFGLVFFVGGGGGGGKHKKNFF